MQLSPATTSPSRMRHGLLARLLAPLLVGLGIMLCTLIAGAFHAQNQQFRKTVERDIAELNATFQDELHHDTKLMQATLQSLSRNPSLRDAFVAGDRKTLLAEAAPLLQGLRSDFGIAKLLFITPDRRCLLRAHRPELAGDVIDHYSLLQCARSSESFAGLELDAGLGRFVLRAVVPWYRDEALIGYLQLEKETGLMQDRMREEHGIDLFLLIDKNRVTRTSWEEGMRRAGRSPDWERFPSVVVGDQTLPFVPSAVTEFLATQAPEAGRIIPIREDNAYFEGHFVPIDDSAGRHVGWLAVLMDLTDFHTTLNQSILFVTILCISLAAALGAIFFGLSRKVENVLRASDAHIRLQAAALESAATPILITDTDGRITWSNEAYSRLSHYSPRELRGTVPGVLHPRSRRSAEIWGVIRDGKSWEGEVTGERKGGEIYPEQLAVTPVRDARSEITNYLLVAQDISNHKLAQFELKRAREEAETASNVKSAFVANIGHELRTPLTGVIGMMDILKETSLDDAQLDCVDTAGRCARSLLSLINDLLDFSKISAGKLEFERIPFEIENELESVLRPFQIEAEQKGVELLCDMDDGVPPNLEGDPTRLAQVIRNLVANAIKFTDAGEVTLRVEPADPVAESGDDPAVDEHGEGSLLLRFEVSDTGIGIARESIGNLFEAFAQADSSTSRKYGGSGLGLAICRQLVEGMNGEISVESREGAGSTFSFTARFGAAGEPEPPATDPPGRILVVDDHPASLDLMTAALRTGGHSVDESTAGPLALERLQEAIDVGRPYDLIVTDLQMPIMSGDQLADRVLNAAARPPLVLILAPVGWSPGPDIAPITTTLQKPVGARRLRREAALLIRRARTRPRSPAGS